jgi:hypothetical protein
VRYRDMIVQEDINAYALTSRSQGCLVELDSLQGYRRPRWWACDDGCVKVEGAHHYLAGTALRDVSSYRTSEATTSRTDLAARPSRFITLFRFRTLFSYIHFSKIDKSADGGAFAIATADA